MTRGHYFRLVALLVFLAVLFVVFEVTGMREQFSLEFLRDQIERNVVAGLLIFVVLFSLGNLIQIPGLIFLGAAVLTLGKGWGGLATYAGAITACAFSFFVVGSIGGDVLRDLDGNVARRLFARLDRHPVRAVFMLRVVFQTAPALNYALALSGVRFRHYLAGTMLGLPIPIAIYCLAFDLVREYLLKLP